MKAAMTLSLTCLLLAACGGEQQASAVQAFMQDPDAVARGRALFIGTCAGYCHKTTPEASDAPYLFDREWIHGGTDEAIYNTIVNGVPGTRMIAFGTNFPEGEDDLWKIIAYLRTSQQ